MSLSKVFITAILGFAAGVYLAPYFSFSPLATILAVFTLTVLLIIFRQEKILVFVALFSLLMIVGLSYSHLYQKHFIKNDLTKFHRQKVILTGYIGQPIDERPDKNIITMTVQKVKVGGKNHSAQGQVLIYGPKFPSYHLGDSLQVSGVLQEPPVFPDFNYKNYLARYQIYSVMFPEEIKSLPLAPDVGPVSNFWLSFKESLFAVKNRFETLIGQILPEPQGAFLDGLLLGVKKFIPQNLLDNFAATGTTHILVISGFNITIIIKAFMAITRRWSRRLSYTLAIAGVFTFVIITGASAPVVRAAIMALLIMWAEREGRRSDAAIALIVAGLIMILINPLILRFDIGFQLSFMATAGLIYVSPIIKSWFTKSRLRKTPEIIAEAATATLAAQIAVLPILLANFGRLSLIAPLANILILPVIPLTMLLGFVAVMAGFIFLPAGQLIGLTAWLLLSYIILVVEKLAALPYASLDIARFNWLWASVYYGLLLLAIFIYYFRQRKLLEAESKTSQPQESLT